MINYLKLVGTAFPCYLEENEPDSLIACKQLGIFIHIPNTASVVSPNLPAISPRFKPLALPTLNIFAGSNQSLSTAPLLIR